MESAENSAEQKRGLSVDTYTPKTISMDEFKKLSRNQQKKHMRQELWREHADEFKAKMRQKNKESRKRRRKRIALGETASKKRQEQTHSGCRVIVDMDFDDKMDEKEIKSMCSQINRCYSVNRNAAKMVDLYVTKLHGKCKERFGTALIEHLGWAKEYIAMETKNQLVYLTADSPNIIDELDASKFYIIGGIVDKNRYPRLTLDKAESQGISHGQLPIGKYVRMSTRKIMTVNQIFEMLIKFLEVSDWEQAFLEAIPQRKFKEGDSRADTTSDSESDN
ncbi:guanine-1-methyltransferase-domain-containing protein [Coemansia spiralis]|nr:guanine-1-methyltransferase-domain-containing protein [Coemansia spiralis]